MSWTTSCCRTSSSTPTPQRRRRTHRNRSLQISPPRVACRWALPCSWATACWLRWRRSRASAPAAAALAAWRPADLLHAVFRLLDRRPAVEQSGDTAAAIRMAGQLVALLAAAPGSAAATAAAGAAKQYAWRTRLLLAPLLASVVAHGGGGGGGGGGSGGNRVAAPGLTPPALRALPVHAAEPLAAAGVALADLVAAAAPDSSAPAIPNCPCLLRSYQSACWRHHWSATCAARRLDCMWFTVELIVVLAPHTLPASRHVNAN